MKTLLVFIILGAVTLLRAQPTVRVEVSADTIEPGALVEVTYTIENGEGHFTPPDFKNIPLVSGPSTSSSFMISNGKKTSSQSYSFVLRPADKGNILIPQASFREGDHVLTIDPVTIVVMNIGERPSTAATVNKSIKQTREKKKF